jgi:hypothetical protein
MRPQRPRAGGRTTASGRQMLAHGSFPRCPSMSEDALAYLTPEARAPRSPLRPPYLLAGWARCGVIMIPSAGYTIDSCCSSQRTR